jgi:hypothetical protein
VNNSFAGRARNDFIFLRAPWHFLLTRSLGRSPPLLLAVRLSRSPVRPSSHALSRLLILFVLHEFAEPSRAFFWKLTAYAYSPSACASTHTYARPGCLSLSLSLSLSLCVCACACGARNEFRRGRSSASCRRATGGGRVAVARGGGRRRRRRRRSGDRVRD